MQVFHSKVFLPAGVEVGCVVWFGVGEGVYNTKYLWKTKTKKILTIASPPHTTPHNIRLHNSNTNAHK